LQQVDSLLDQACSRLKEVQALLDDNTALAAAEKELRLVEEILDQERKRLRQAENQVRDQKIKIEQNESTLYSGKIRNPKELQDLQNDVASLKRYLAVLEDKQLEGMLAVDDAEKARDQARMDYERVQGRLVEARAHLQGEKSQLIQSIDRLEVERQVAESAIPAEQMEIYTHLKRVRRGIAVASILDRTCSACGSTLTPAMIQAANSPTQVVRCSSCGRILYPG
jgi:predicted  nucleic acid-binding Zn-ribbon protein